MFLKNNGRHGIYKYFDGEKTEDMYELMGFMNVRKLNFIAKVKRTDRKDVYCVSVLKNRYGNNKTEIEVCGNTEELDEFLESYLKMQVNFMNRNSQRSVGDWLSN